MKEPKFSDYVPTGDFPSAKGVADYQAAVKEYYVATAIKDGVDRVKTALEVSVRNLPLCTVHGLWVKLVGFRRNSAHTEAIQKEIEARLVEHGWELVRVCETDLEDTVYVEIRIPV